MAILNWSEEYVIGVTAIDRDHRHLFECVNAFHEAVQGRKGAAALGHTLEKLVEYTKGHFGREEEFLMRGSYPGLKLHQISHAALVEQLVGFVTAFQASRPIHAGAFVGFLSDWLKHHILGEDKAYAPWVRSGSAAPQLLPPDPGGRG